MTTHTPITLVRSLVLALACLVPAVAIAQPRPIPIAMMAPPLEGELNVNSASAEQWELLPGIGPTTAARILAFIAKRKVTHASQLMRVKGIGRKTYDRIKPYLVLEGETTLHVAQPQEDATTGATPETKTP
jgi:competence protein ComEA